MLCLGVTVGCSDTPKDLDATPSAPPMVAPVSSCNLERLDALADRLRSASPRSRKAQVADGLVATCSMPAYASEFLEATAPERLAHARPSLSETPSDVVRTVCPAWDDVEGTPEAIYQGCDLASAGLIDPFDWSRGHPTSLVPFAMHAWLLKQEASPASARIISQALLLRDRRTWALPEQSIPSVAYSLPPVPHGPIVHMTKDEIIAGDERATKRSDYLAGAPALDDEVLVALAQSQGVAKPDAIVVADASALASTIIELDVSLRRAGFDRVALVAENRPLEFGAEALRGLERARDAQELRIRGQGFTFVRGNERSYVEPRESASDYPYDFAALAEEARRGVVAGTPTHIMVSVSDSIMAELLIGAIAAVRAGVCEAGSAACDGLEVSLYSHHAARHAGLFGVIGGRTRTLGLGVSGAGSSGGVPRPRRPTPRVRQAKAKVGRGLDRDIVRRIVRAHINEIRYCYNKALLDDPKLSERVTATFTIESTGKVGTASAKSRTSHRDLEACVAKAVGRWKFPRPYGGSSVDVIYPFVMSPG